MSNPHLGALAWLATLIGLATCRDAGAVDIVFPAKEWAKAAPESQGVDPGRLAEAVAYLEQHAGPDGVKRLVIVRRGRMIWTGAVAHRRQPVASITKAFTSTAHGLLIADGKCTLDTLAKDFNPEHLAELYPLVTLRHLATMTSGYDGFGGSYDCDERKERCDANAFVPPSSPVFPPGTRFMYWDEATQEYGYVLTRIAGEPIPDLLRRRVLDPIGVTAVAWDRDATGEHLNWTGGLEISAADLARFGYLYLNRGAWAGKQLIDAAWVDEATRVQVPASVPSGHAGADHREGSGVYGYHWWPNGIKPDGQRKWPDAPVGAYARSGYKNNYCFVIPEWGMVVVWLGLERTHKITDRQWNEFLKRMGRAIRREGQ
jgi:CubicO group peptidase (beta-lactamase class C family)